MRIAVLSDVHADLASLRDALRQIERLGCDEIVCAGDLVDWGEFPNETIELLRDRGIPCIRGNHDRWAIERADKPSPHPVGPTLSASTLDFLRGLPLRWDRVIAGVRVAVRHGTPTSDMQGIDPAELALDDFRRWVGQAGADVLIVGHTHVPFVASAISGEMIANPGALLRAPGATPPGGGTFGVLELPAREFTVHLAADGEIVVIPRIKVGVRDMRGD